MEPAAVDVKPPAAAAPKTKKGILPASVKRAPAEAANANAGFIRVPTWLAFTVLGLLAILLVHASSRVVGFSAFSGGHQRAAVSSTGGSLQRGGPRSGGGGLIDEGGYDGDLARAGEEAGLDGNGAIVVVKDAAGMRGRRRGTKRAGGKASKRQQAADDDAAAEEEEEEEEEEATPAPSQQQQQQQGGAAAAPAGGAAAEVDGEEATDDDSSTDDDGGEGEEEGAAPVPPPSSEPAPAAIPLRLLHTLPSSLPFCDHVTCTGVRRVISIALYGGNPRYTNGAVRNSEIVREAFPDWELWVYIPDPAVNPNYAVPEEVKKVLRGNGAKLLFVDAATIAAVGFGMNQRFLPAEDPTVARFASRDGDSRLLLRERWAMDEWEESGKPFHLLRDHPSHSNFFISGGLWGATHDAVPNIRALLTSARSGGAKENYLDDMNFLNADVGPIMKEKGVLQHDAFTCEAFGEGGRGYPYARAGGEHVGGVYDGEDHIRAGDVALLMPAQSQPRCISPVYRAEDRLRLTPEDIAQCAPPAFAPAATGGGGGANPADALAQLVAAQPAAGGDGGSGGPTPLGKVACPSLADATGKFKDVSLLGSIVAAPPADAGAGGGPARPLRLVVAFQWKKAFVNHLLPPCERGVVQPPPAFDYKRVFALANMPSECGADPLFWHVAQYHERIHGGATHYEALGGVRYNRHLLYAPGWYTGNPHFAVGHALPHLLQFLHGGPAGGRALLPLTTLPAAKAVLEAAFSVLPLDTLAATGVSRLIEGSEDNKDDSAAEGVAATHRLPDPAAYRPPAPVPPPAAPLPTASFAEWSGGVTSRWVRSHEESPALYYSHRMYVAAAAQKTTGHRPGSMCAAQTCYATTSATAAAAQCGVNALTMAAHAVSLSRGVQKALHAPAVVAAAATGSVTGTLRGGDFACSAVIQLPSGYDASSGGYGEAPTAHSASATPAYAGRLAALKTALSRVGLDAVVLDAGCDSSRMDAPGVGAAGVVEDVGRRLKAYLAADVAVLPPNTFTPYLQLSRRKGTVLVASALLPDDAPASPPAGDRAAESDWSNGPAAAQGALETVCEALGPSCVALAAAGRTGAGGAVAQDLNVDALVAGLKEALPADLLAACGAK